MRRHVALANALALGFATSAEPTTVIALPPLRVKSVTVQVLVGAHVPQQAAGSLSSRIKAECENRLSTVGVRVVRADKAVPTLFVGAVGAVGHPAFPEAVALRVWIVLLSPDGGRNPRAHLWDSDELGTGIVHLAHGNEAETVALDAVIEKLSHFASRVK